MPALDRPGRQSYATGTRGLKPLLPPTHRLRKLCTPKTEGITPIWLQDGEANDKVHALVRIQFNALSSYDARQAFPKAAFIKELSFRSAKPETAHKFAQVRALVGAHTQQGGYLVSASWTMT